MKALIAHLRQHSVYKDGGIYLAVAWLLTRITVSLEHEPACRQFLDEAVAFIES